jgi:hypothetical protein
MNTEQLEKWIKENEFNQIAGERPFVVRSADLRALFDGKVLVTKTQISEAIFGWGLRNDDGNHLSMDDTDEIAEYIMAQALLSAAKGGEV